MANMKTTTHTTATTQASDQNQALIQSEQVRLSEILRSSEAYNNFEQAITLAFDTNIPATKVIDILRDMRTPEVSAQLPGLALCEGNDLGPDAYSDDDGHGTDAAKLVLGALEQASTGRTL